MLKRLVRHFKSIFRLTLALALSFALGQQKEKSRRIVIGAFSELRSAQIHVSKAPLWKLYLKTKLYLVVKPQSNYFLSTGTMLTRGCYPMRSLFGTKFNGKHCLVAVCLIIAEIKDAVSL